jgi:hypothetical protein
MVCPAWNALSSSPVFHIDVHADISHRAQVIRHAKARIRIPTRIGERLCTGIFELVQIEQLEFAIKDGLIKQVVGAAIRDVGRRALWCDAVWAGRWRVSLLLQTEG